MLNDCKNVFDQERNFYCFLTCYFKIYLLFKAECNLQTHNFKKKIGIHFHICGFYLV